MSLEPLFTFHLPKSEGTAAALPPAEGVFVVETCLRHIGVSRRLPEAFVPGTEIFQGKEAYRFMLEVACGLHSRMQGESEIFGQVKEGWKQFSQARAPEAKPLFRTMQHLFADTKRIRTHYLHGLGGQSYPGAVQRLLGLTRESSLLIIGAGQFGQMLASKLLARSGAVTIANRTLLPLQLLKSKHPGVAILPGFEGLEEAIQAADHVIMCLPAGADEALDARIQAAFKGRKTGHLLHLGQMDFSGTDWAKTPRFLGLSDVMDIQNHRSKAKPQAIERAFEAARLLTEERAHGACFKSRLQKAA